MTVGQWPKSYMARRGLQLGKSFRCPWVEVRMKQVSGGEVEGECRQQGPWKEVPTVCGGDGGEQVKGKAGCGCLMAQERE